MKDSTPGTSRENFASLPSSDPTVNSEKGAELSVS